MTLIYGYILLLRIELQVIRLQGNGAAQAQAGHFLFKGIILKLLIDLSPRRNSAIQATEPNSHIQYLAMRSRGCGSKDFPYKIFTLLKRNQVNPPMGLSCCHPCTLQRERQSCFLRRERRADYKIIP